MKRTLAASVILFAAAFTLGIVPRAHAIDHKCSNATLQGSYGYTATGTLLPAGAPPPFAGPFGEVGRQTFDGNGNTSGTATLSANGNSANITVTGTYTVNPDCTGSMTVNVAPLGVTTHADFVIDNDGLQIRTISTDVGTVETRVYTKQFRGDGPQQW
jgi:hypothetical protein